MVGVEVLESLLDLVFSPSVSSSSDKVVFLASPAAATGESSEALSSAVDVLGELEAEEVGEVC